MADRLVVRGAREHNLKNVNLDLPRDALIVFTGLSGSGKSSLAFDTIFAEGQRRYVESLSAYARQFLGQMDKPDVDFIEGLSPAVSIDQKSTNRNPRSTVGTITEVYDYLRLLYARIGHPHCPVCGEPIARQTPQQIVDHILELPEDTRFQVLAPVIRERKGEYQDLFADLQVKGYARARVDGVVYPLTDVPKLKKQEKHTIEAVVDRLSARPTSKQRITDSVETALGLAGGVVILDFVDLPETDEHRERRYSERLACPNDHPLAIDELEPRSFSFNSPFGACPVCSGLGTRREVDPELVVPDPELSLAEGAIAPWSGGQTSEYFLRLLEGLSEQIGFSLDTPWEKLTTTAQKAVLHGVTGQVHVHYRNRYGRDRSYYAAYEGVLPWIERRYAETESDYSREKYEGFMREVPCPTCLGTRLKPEILAVTVDGRSIADLSALSIGSALRWLNALTLNDRDRFIAERVLKEVNARLGFLVDVGLDYLSLDRAAATLAGGEAQRIRLATQIGSGLVGVLYVLDEPSIGLHQRDNRRLIETLARLKALGNTLIVVEHDEDTIRAADWVVDIGPWPASTAATWSCPAPSMICSTRRTRSPAPTCPAVGRSRSRWCAGRGRRTTLSSSKVPASTTCATSMSRSRSAASWPLPASAARASRRWSMTSSMPRWRTASTARGCSPGVIAGFGVSTSSTRWWASISRRSGGLPARTRPPTPASSITFASSTPRRPRRRSAATSRAGSRSTSRVAAARTAPATERSRSR